MSGINLVRIAKLVALLAFFLPWAAVSCQGTDVATASGIELMQGKMTANPDFERQMGQTMGNAFGASPGSRDVFGNADFEPTITSRATQAPELGINPFAIGAAIAVLAGLLLSFAGGVRSAARTTLITSLLGIALAFGAFWWFQQGVLRNASEDNSGGMGGGMGGMGGGGAMAAQMMESMVQQRFGLWINMLALVVAAGSAGLIMARKDAAAPPPDA